MEKKKLKYRNFLQKIFEKNIKERLTERKEFVKFVKFVGKNDEIETVKICDQLYKGKEFKINRFLSGNIRLDGYYNGFRCGFSSTRDYLLYLLENNKIPINKKKSIFKKKLLQHLNIKNFNKFYIKKYKKLINKVFFKKGAV